MQMGHENSGVIRPIGIGPSSLSNANNNTCDRSLDISRVKIYRPKGALAVGDVMRQKKKKNRRVNRGCKNSDIGENKILELIGIKFCLWIVLSVTYS